MVSSEALAKEDRSEPAIAGYGWQAILNSSNVLYLYPAKRF
jgi:hypothetical protein